MANGKPETVKRIADSLARARRTSFCSGQGMRSSGHHRYRLGDLHRSPFDRCRHLLERQHFIHGAGLDRFRGHSENHGSCFVLRDHVAAGLLSRPSRLSRRRCPCRSESRRRSSGRDIAPQFRELRRRRAYSRRCDRCHRARSVRRSRSADDASRDKRKSCRAERLHGSPRLSRAAPMTSANCTLY